MLANPPSRQLDTLSDWGRFLFYPENDVLFYAAGVVGTVAFALALCWVWNQRLRVSQTSSRRWLVWPVLQVVVAFGVAAAFMSVYLRLRWSLFSPDYFENGLSVPDPYIAVFGLLVLVSLASVLIGQPLPHAGTLASSGPPTSGEGSPKKRRRANVVDLLVPLVILAIFYAPQWRKLSGEFFLVDVLIHWDFFAMGPALAFSHGRALGSDVYSIYGIGWPIVFGWLSRWLPLAYGRMIQVGSIYVGIYFAGVYLFLRLAVRRPTLAILGTGLAMLPMFVWLHGLSIWRVPNVTPMRWAFDIWCLIAIQRYLATGKRVWAAAAGCLIGLALIFTIDTGLELGAAAGGFWLCTLWLRDRRPQVWRDLGICVASAFGVLILGLLIGSRGTLLSSGFLHGWLEAALDFGGGFGMLPLTFAPGKATMICFALLAFFNLAVVGYVLIRVWIGHAHRFELLDVTLALYGLLVLVKFLGHSADSIFPRLLTPAALLLTVLAGRAFDAGGSWVARNWAGTRKARMVRAAPYAVLAGAAICAVSIVPVSRLLAPVESYPGWLSSRFDDPEPDGLCLMVQPRDICGLPPGLSSSVEKFRTLTGRLRGLEDRGYTFAVLDQTGSLPYLAAGSSPFGRYAGLLTTAFRNEQVNRVAEQFEERPPDFFLLRLASPEGTEEFDRWKVFGPGPGELVNYDTWDAIETIVRKDYRPITPNAPYQIWQRLDLRNPPPEG